MGWIEITTLFNVKATFKVAFLWRWTMIECKKKPTVLHYSHFWKSNSMLKVFIENLAVKLAHAPAASQGFSFIELASMVVFDRWQTHVCRPRKGKSVYQFRPTQCRRRCLRFFRRYCGLLLCRFRRHCLRNCPCQVKLAHLLQVTGGKTTPKLLRQIYWQ